MSNNNYSFGFFSGGSGGPAPTTPDWQAVTTAGNTTDNDIFVQDTVLPTPNSYLKVDVTNNLYFLGNAVTSRGVSIDANGQFYVFGENTGVKIVISGGASPVTSFSGTTIYQFPDSIAAYAGGLYKAIVLNTGAVVPAIELQPKDMVPISAQVASYTATDNDCILLVTPISPVVAPTITLPTAGILPGKRFYIKKCGGVVNVIINPAGAATIDGAATKTISTLYECIQCVFDGSNYWII